MSDHKYFEELPVWRKARELVTMIYRATRQPAFARDAGLCCQIQRAAVSVASNIAEGHERGTTTDLILFLYYAKGSAGEVRSQLYHAEDLGYLPLAEAQELRQAAARVSRQLFAWIVSMQNPSFHPGPKYHKEADHSMERWLESIGMERLPNGQMQEIAKPATTPQNTDET